MRTPIMIRPIANTVVSLFKSQAWLILLFVISLTVAISNYDPSTWLTGWDTLHPEFDFGLNLQRMLFGAWREDQGLGTLAIHAHLSDLPRILTLWVFSWVLPLHTVKYVYVLLCLLLGPLGIYHLVRTKVLAGKTYAASSAFLAGLWYLLNLGTVQHFYVVFEMFAVQYSALGWLFYLAIEYLQKPRAKTLMLFAVVSFIATPMAYAPTLWYAYVAGLFLFCLTYWLQDRSRAVFIHSAQLGGVTLAVNLFWLLPNLYLIFSGASVIPAQSHINELFSPEAFLHNQAYGSIDTVLLLKNFLFNWLEFSPATNSYHPLLSPWIEHLQRPLVTAIGIAFSTAGILGLLLAPRTQRRIVLSFIPMTCLALFMLINANPPFTPIFEFLRSHSTLFEEGLRFPFTKFSLVLMLSLSVGIGVVFERLQLLFSKRLSQMTFLVPAMAALALVWFCWPAFGGQLINHKMRNTIPESYFSLMEFAETLPSSARIVQLPLQTSAGWDQYDWNYEGPGFLWFGLRQPLLVRDFDRWNPDNELVYQQLSRALYSADASSVLSISEQYAISYAVFDRSIITNSEDLDEQQADDLIATTLSSAGAIKIWEQDFLSMYQLPAGLATSDAVNSFSSLYSVQNPGNFAQSNHIYQQLGPFTTRDTAEFIFPFSSTTADRPQQITIDDVNGTATLRATVPASTSTQILESILKPGSSFTTSASVSFSDGKATIAFAPTGTVIISDQESSLPQLQPIVVDVDSPASSVMLEIGSQLFFVSTENPESLSLPVTLIAHEKPDIFVVPDVQESEKITDISAERISIVQPENDIWQEFSKPFRVQILPSVEPTQLTVVLETTAVKIPLTSSTSTVQCSHDRLTDSEVLLQSETTTFSSNKKEATCTTFILGKQSVHDYGLLRIEGQQQSGRSLKLYVDNDAVEVHLLEHLLPDGSYDVTYPLAGWSVESDFLSTLMLENRSFGERLGAKNTLNKITFYPLALNFLSNVSVRPAEGSTAPAPRALALELQKASPTQYTVITPTSSVVTLTQGYNPGWIAFPALQPWMLYEHVRYNGWANAWIIDSAQDSEGAKDQQRITILYWPQLLTFTGYGVLVLTLTGLGWLAWQDRGSRRATGGRTIESLSRRIRHQFFS